MPLHGSLAPKLLWIVVMVSSARSLEDSHTENIPPDALLKTDTETLPQACGVTTLRGPKIIGGGSARPGQFPWQVAIMTHNFFSERIHCGGALISELYVLTAGHCVYKTAISRMRVRLAGHLIEADSYHRIEEILLHPDFRWLGMIPSHDIALLKLAGPVEFNKYIGPICLPEKETSFLGRTAVVSGWGTLKHGVTMTPSSLQKVEVPLVSNDICRSWFSSQSLTPKLLDSMICAGFEQGGRDACQGDSGGPLILNDNGRAQVIGVVSWGVACALPKAPGVYTKVSCFVDWINEVMRDTSRAAGPPRESATALQPLAIND